MPAGGEAQVLSPEGKFGHILCWPMTSMYACHSPMVSPSSNCSRGVPTTAHRRGELGTPGLRGSVPSFKVDRVARRPRWEVCILCIWTWAENAVYFVYFLPRNQDTHYIETTRSYQRAAGEGKLPFSTFELIMGVGHLKTDH